MAHEPTKFQPLVVGPVIYSIQEVPDLHDTDNDGKKQELFGYINYKDLLLQLDEGMTPPQQLATILHEAVHAILEQGGQDIPENAVVTLGYGLANLLINNPWLTKIA